MHQQTIVDIIQKNLPDVQAVYFFGSYNTEYEKPDSDIDIAILLPPKKAKGISSLYASQCFNDLTTQSGRSIDLIDIRNANTVFQFQIITTANSVSIFDKKEAAIFEMLTLSFYQKLNDERAFILQDILKSGKVLRI